MTPDQLYVLDLYLGTTITPHRYRDYIYVAQDHILVEGNWGSRF